jgi:hypothetical protein
MFYLAGDAASSALDLISKLQQTLASRVAGAQTSSDQQTQTASTFDPSGTTTDTSGAANGTSGTQIAPDTMSALLSVQGQGQPLLVNGDAFSQQLFGLLDTNGDGSISKSEFESAFSQDGSTTQADSIFSQLDANGDGSVSSGELLNALENGSQGQGQGTQQAHHHHHHHGGGMGMSEAGGSSAGSGSGDASGASSGGSTDPLMQPDQSQSVTNADGSTTTTITYADGSSVSMTTPGSTSGSGASPNNFIERMIQNQAQMLSSQTAGQSLMVNV